MATPCWPAPVSATRRVLPIRLASSAWPSTLLILCEPVWLRSSRLSSRRMPSSLAEVVALGEDRRAAGVVAQDVVELARGTPGSAQAVAERRLQLLARRHKRLGDEPPAELAEAAGGVGLRPAASRRRPRPRVGIGVAHSSSQSYGMLVGPEVRLRRGGPGVLDEALDRRARPCGPATSRRRVATSTPHGSTTVDRRRPRSPGSARRRGSASRLSGTSPTQRPVEHLARAGLGAVDQHHVGAVPVGACGSSGRAALNALITQRTAWRPRPLLGRLVAVQLHGLDTRPGAPARPRARAARRGTRRRSGSRAAAGG